MDTRMLTILQHCPILPRSEIYYFYKNKEQYVYKQGNRFPVINLYMLHISLTIYYLLPLIKSLGAKFILLLILVNAPKLCFHIFNTFIRLIKKTKIYCNQ